jgi:hypothetical protein
MQSIANAQPVKAGQAVGGWLRDMDEANARHLHKCIQYTARLYGSEVEGQ